MRKGQGCDCLVATDGAHQMTWCCIQKLLYDNPGGGGYRGRACISEADEAEAGDKIVLSLWPLPICRDPPPPPLCSSIVSG
jgi:hypothetical protein